MPHKCTGCDAIYNDGSEDVLEGCSNCDGNSSFQFIPESALSKSSDIVEAESDWNVISNSGESSKEEKQDDDSAQSRARSMMPSGFSFGKTGADNASTDESGGDTDKDDIIVAEANSELDDADEVAERLKEQFGSIKILEPGHYSLNLRKMYEDDDYIITVEEDGRYIVQSLSGWNPHN